MARTDYKLDHVACGVRSIGACLPYVQGTLGGVPYEIGPGAGFRFAQLEFENGGRIELLQPLAGQQSFMDRFLAAHGPGVHHVTFKVPSLSAAADAARAVGYDVVGYDDSHPSWKEAFLHPKQAQGIVIQFAEVDASQSAWEPNPQDFPPAPGAAPVEAPPAPLSFLGLVVTARSEAEALRQWSQLLGGEAEIDSDSDSDSDSGGGRIGFSWVDSPLRVWAQIDPQRRPGPLCLRFAGKAHRALGEQPQPLLGATITSG